MATRSACASTNTAKSSRSWRACARLGSSSTKCSCNKLTWKISSCRSWMEVRFEHVFRGVPDPVLQRNPALLESGHADGGGAHPDSHAVLADLRPRARGQARSLSGRQLHRLFDSRPGDDERAAKRLRQC